MPYCPKCDMEFIDGITVCSDCGGPLLASREEALAMMAEARKQEEERLAAEYERMQAEQERLQTGQEDPEDSGDGEQASGDFAAADAGTKKAAETKSEGRAYLSKRQQYEDMKSSVSAFLIVGIILTAFGLLCFAGIIRLPFGAGSMILFETVLTAMGIGSLAVALVTKKSAAKVAAAADEEDARTRELTEWFVNTYTASGLDEALLKEDAELEGNELYLKRFELIQDHLITSHDLPNRDYVDFLCEEIYARVFE